MDSSRLFENGAFILRDIARAKAGESVLVIADRDTRREAEGLAACAASLGLLPLLVDISEHGGPPGFTRYHNMPLVPPLRAAIEAADICLMTTEQKYTDFGILMHERAQCDLALLGDNRRYTVDIHGIDEWRLDRAELLAMRERTRRLLDALRRGRTLRVTTEIGTDFTCAVGSAPDGVYPVLGIVPLYAEVAVVPSLGSVTGRLVVDGASQFSYVGEPFPIRPNFAGGRELDCPPLVIELKESVVTSYGGDARQLGRLEAWMFENEPYANIADEVGIVTTQSDDNDRWHWKFDGTHQSRCVHVALGNNNRKDACIHGKKHVDFDMHAPDIHLDGRQICKRGVYLDDVIFSL